MRPKIVVSLYVCIYNQNVQIYVHGKTSHFIECTFSLYKLEIVVFSNKHILDSIKTSKLCKLDNFT